MTKNQYAFYCCNALDADECQMKNYELNESYFN